MKRREFMRLAAVAPLAVKAPLAFARSDESAAPRRVFEMTYEVDLTAHPDAGRLWLPLPQDLGHYQQLLSVTWSDSATGAAMHRDTSYGANIFSLAWSTKMAPKVSVSARVATRDRVTARAARCLYDNGEAEFYLNPSDHMPIDGIVAETAEGIVKASMSADEKARAIYDWVVDNTFREPKTRGCGLGDIKFMLESGNLGGKCADINSLFVGLARAAGIPAREVYGVRVAQSKQFKSLGASGNISKAHHCRAEYFSPRYGWVAVDPADVRKAVLQEKLALDDPKIQALREQLFGNWEMNWVGFNSARDFALPPAGSGPIPYLMYPYAEIGDRVLDGRDPGEFAFTLTSREVTV